MELRNRAGTIIKLGDRDRRKSLLEKKQLFDTEAKGYLIQITGITEITGITGITGIISTRKIFNRASREKLSREARKIFFRYV